MVVARRVGVPEMWVEDAVQEIALAVWQTDDPRWKVIARRTAIDFARQYGHHSGRTTRFQHPQMVSTTGLEMLLDDLSHRARSVEAAYFRRRVTAALSAPDTLTPRLACLDAKDAIARLTPAQRRNLLNRESGMSHDTLRYQARQRLRKLCA